jgi:nucleotide-binding universal stress UspA family protein
LSAPTNSIVVPLDGSKAAEQAVPSALALATALKAPLAFVHVHSGEGPSTGGREHGEEVFESYARTLKGVQSSPYTTATVVSGSPSEAILEFAKAARLIVIASHGRSGFRASLLGSVADKVVRGANIPVLVVPAVDAAPAIGSGPMVVALDGSEHAEAGLALARELAAVLKTGVVCVRSYDLMPPPYAEISYYAPDLSEGLEADATDYLKRTAKAGEKMVVARGLADAVIIEAAEQTKASVVVMTTQGMGLARRIALGSTTDRVLHSLKRPLLIVPAH